MWIFFFEITFKTACQSTNWVLVNILVISGWGKSIEETPAGSGVCVRKRNKECLSVHSG